jgi:hypothetical protein
MTILAVPMTVLAWLGRQGTRALVAVLLLAILVPTLGALLRPLVPEAIFVLLVVAFVRVDAAALRGYLARPAIVLAATGWTMLGIPALLGGACLAFGLDHRAPDLFLALILQSVASPMMAAPAFAALMGLDATLVLVTLVVSTALTPLTAPLFAYGFIGSALTLSPLGLGLRLFAILAGALIAAALIRLIAGMARIARSKAEIDGLNIITVFVFVAAVMGNVAGQFLAAPLRTTALLALAFVVSFAVLAATTLTFARTGGARAFVIGLMASQRNMGLMLAATGGALPDQVWLYFALCQFPIYLAPQLLKPLARRFTRHDRA